MTAAPIPSVQSCLKWLYVHNPFYLISVCTLLYGVHVSFTESAGIAKQPAAKRTAKPSLDVTCPVCKKLWPAKDMRQHMVRPIP